MLSYLQRRAENRICSFPQITFDLLKPIHIRIPSKTEQQKIVSVLSSINKKINLNRNLHAKLEDIAKLLYDYWFVQFDFPDEKGKPYKSSGGKMAYNKQLKRKIPEGWGVGRLGSLFESNRGVSYNSACLTGKGVPMINLASFNIDGSYKHSGLKSYSGDYSDDKILKPFDLVMCNTQQTDIDYDNDIIGKAFLVPDIFSGDVVSSHHVTSIKVKKENLKYYLHRLFNTKHFHRYAAGHTNGTNILGLIFSGIEDYTTEITDDAILEKFAKIMDVIEKQKSVIIKENQQLVELRDWLLPMLMNGQVKVG
jgi:type I restriction enzyme S subunit